MSLYPSLEDMQVDQLSRAQMEQMLTSPTAVAPAPLPPPSYHSGAYSIPENLPENNFYPSLANYMGLELSEAVIRENMPEYLNEHQKIAVYQQPVVSNGNSTMIAPLSGQSVALCKSQVTNGIREFTLCKGKDDKIGLRLKEIDRGIFIVLVVQNSPAALAGLRFGDQILQLNDENLLGKKHPLYIVHDDNFLIKPLPGYSIDKVYSIIKKCSVNNIKIVVRDRPFERTIVLHKDSTNSLGFGFKYGKITTIVKDSSAARNGVLINHQLLEINGQNVVGLRDKQIKEIIAAKAGNVVTITIMPSFLYEHMIKKMSGSLIKNMMDHSITYY